MRTITFTETVQYECEGRKKGPTFKRGHVLRDAPDDFAERWLRRGNAVEGEVKLDEDLSKAAADEDPAPARLPDADKVEIPEDLKRFSAGDAVQLAAKLWSIPAKSRREAIEIIEAELKLRADAASKQAQ